MLDPDQGWNLSLAGCGFSSVYYLGALSCFLDRVPQLVHGASRICGASSGCLVAAAVTVGIPLHGFCADVLDLARTARTRPLGVLHPAFGLLCRVRDVLLDKLPADAHLRASGRLCVSLTRLADGGNLLVSQFDSREELVQVLLCSCFFPVYCGFVPPSYRGELFLDGALSNNLPLSEQRNTITMAPFRGESDICPKDDSFNPVQVHCCSLSVQVSSRNLHRICTSFLPPSVQNLAEICHSGYVDALRFLGAQGLITAPLPQPLSLEQPGQDQEPGQDPDLEPGQDPDQEPGQDPDLEPGQDPDQEPGQDLDLEPGQDPDLEPGQDLDLEPGQDPDQEPGQDPDLEPVTSCCGLKPQLDDHSWLDPRVVENLPVSFQRVLCAACRVGPDAAGFLGVELLTYFLSLLLLPVELSFLFISSVMSSGWAAIGRLCRQVWSQSGSCRGSPAGRSRSSCSRGPLRSQRLQDQDGFNCRRDAKLEAENHVYGAHKL